MKVLMMWLPRAAAIPMIAAIVAANIMTTNVVALADYTVAVVPGRNPRVISNPGADARYTTVMSATNVIALCNQAYPCDDLTQVKAFENCARPVLSWIFDAAIEVADCDDGTNTEGIDDNVKDAMVLHTWTELVIRWGGYPSNDLSEQKVFEDATIPPLFGLFDAATGLACGSSDDGMVASPGDGVTDDAATQASNEDNHDGGQLDSPNHAGCDAGFCRGMAECDYIEQDPPAAKLCRANVWRNFIACRGPNVPNIYEPNCP